MSVDLRTATAADMPGLFALRHEVFVLGQGVPEALERDALDAAAEHAIALEDGAVIGTGRLVDGAVDREGQLTEGSSGQVGTIGRMAVASRARGRGVGAALLGLLLQRARDRLLPAVELHAQLHARSFYERAGFTSFGDVYLEAGIEHLSMRKRL